MAEADAAPHRYAIYYAPTPGDAWWTAGSRWLGRCAATGEPRQPPRVPGITDARRDACTRAPRRYGWHATLKAPFRLAPGTDGRALREALRAFAASQAAFALPPLVVRRLDDFLALVPTTPCGELDALASACVRDFQPFAAPLEPEDIARRRRAALTPTQDALMLRWGYPFVLSEFRFHLSLTGSLEEASSWAANCLHDAAAGFFAALPPPRLASLSLFAEPRPGADFVLIEQFPLDAGP